MRVAVITSSDSGYAGKREDVSGPVIEEMVTEYGYEVVHRELLPDDWDVMPEATTAASERLVPGSPEAMRAYSMQCTKRAMLSRAASGIRKSTLIVNLPGSPKAVRECLEYILPELNHGLEILLGKTGECARK